MRAHHLILATLFTATCMSPSMAQNKDTGAMQNQQTQQNRAGGGAIGYITARDANTWKASELIGKDVYGANNEDIGEVGDVLINRNGQVTGLVLDVGGFLGIGETHVAVPMHALQFQTRARADQTPDMARNTTTTGTATAGRDTARTGQANVADNEAAGPDRILLVVTKAQLESAPKFKDDRQASAYGGNKMDKPQKSGSERR